MADKPLYLQRATGGRLPVAAKLGKLRTVGW